MFATPELESKHLQKSPFCVCLTTRTFSRPQSMHCHCTVSRICLHPAVFCLKSDFITSRFDMYPGRNIISVVESFAGDDLMSIIMQYADG